jgi:soluble cytochrome b562
MLRLVLSAVFVFSSFAFADISKNMKAISTTYEQLGKQITDKTKNTSSVKMAQDLIDQSNMAKTQTPTSCEKLTGAAKDQAMEKYKSSMQLMVDHLTKMKAALAANKNDEAKIHFDALKPWTDSSHSKMY